MPKTQSTPKREELLRTIEELKRECTVVRSLSASLIDSVPLSANGRREYMARVAVFYSSIFKSQLEKMVAEQQTELAKFGYPERLSDFYRANINALNLISDWFEGCVAEHVGDIEEARRSEEEIVTDEGINRLKEIVKE